MLLTTILPFIFHEMHFLKNHIPCRDSVKILSTNEQWWILANPNKSKQQRRTNCKCKFCIKGKCRKLFFAFHFFNACRSTWEKDWELTTPLSTHSTSVMMSDGILANTSWRMSIDDSFWKPQCIPLFLRRIVIHLWSIRMENLKKKVPREEYRKKLGR